MDTNKHPLEQKAISHAYTWFAKHGQKSFDELKRLAQEGTAESLEQLHNLADDYGFSYHESTDPIQLVEQIYGAMQADPNIGVE